MRKAPNVLPLVLQLKLLNLAGLLVLDVSHLIEDELDSSIVEVLVFPQDLPGTVGADMNVSILISGLALEVLAVSTGRQAEEIKEALGLNPDAC